MSVEYFQDASTAYYAIERDHFRDAGVMALPVYGAPSQDRYDLPNGGGTPFSCAVIRTHAPIETMIIKWAAVKEGQAPYVPNPYLFNNNYVFLRGRRSGAIPMQMAGYAGHAWSVSGVYEYAVISPYDLNSTFELGILPWEGVIQVQDAVIPNVNFINGLLEKLPLNYVQPTSTPPPDIPVADFLDPILG